jgi:muconolactone delta-isomerase
VIDVPDIRARAKARARRIARRRADLRFRRVLGRYVAAGLLQTNEDVVQHRKPLRVADVLWAGEAEPRLLELLPALLVKKPGLFVDPRDLPDDLDAAVRALRRNREPEMFRGIEGAALLKWLPHVGHKHKLPSQLKTFRMQADDVELLARLQRELGGSQTMVLRRALRALASKASRAGNPAT